MGNSYDVRNNVRSTMNIQHIVCGIIADNMQRILKKGHANENIGFEGLYKE
jgi:hypothetical protein